MHGFADLTEPEILAPAIASEEENGHRRGPMTTAGGTSHTLPCLIPEFRTATTLAFGVMKLLAIAGVLWRCMEAPPVSAVAKMVLGGALVLAVGVLVGSS